MFYIQQVMKYDCGYACLKSLLATIHKDKNYLYLLNPKEDDNAYSYKDLIEIGKRYNLSLTGFKLDNPYKITSNSTFPILLGCEINNIPHMIILTKLNKKYAYVIDPNKGKERWELEKLFSLFNGTGLLIESFTKTKCEIDKPALLTKKEKLSLLFMQFTSCICCILATLFIGDKYPLIYPLLLFSFFAVFEILLRSYSLKLLDNIDKRNVCICSKEHYSDYYYALEKAKKSEMVSSLNLFFSGFVVIVLLVLMILNNQNNLFFLIGGFVFNVFKCLFIIPKIKKNEQQLNFVEAKLFNDESFNEKLNILHKSTYKYALKLNCLKYFEFVIYIINIFLVMGIFNNFDMLNVLFYLCINYLLNSNLTTLFTLKEINEDNDMALLRLLNINKK